MTSIEEFTGILFTVWLIPFILMLIVFWWLWRNK